MIIILYEPVQKRKITTAYRGDLMKDSLYHNHRVFLSNNTSVAAK